MSSLPARFRLTSGWDRCGSASTSEAPTGATTIGAGAHESCEDAEAGSAGGPAQDPRRINMASTARRGLALALVLLAPLAAGCGDDSDTDTDSAAEDAATTTTDAEESKEVVVTGVDYRFEGVPGKAAAGTKFSLENKSTKELHELVAIKLPDAEKRPAADLVKLPQAEQEKLAGGPPAAVLLRPPGSGPQIAAVGDGTLTAPGRYLFICSIPTGADPAAYMEAAQKSQGGPPNVPGGPPHLVQGMFAEVTIE